MKIKGRSTRRHWERKTSNYGRTGLPGHPFMRIPRVRVDDAATTDHETDSGPVRYCRVATKATTSYDPYYCALRRRYIQDPWPKVPSWYRCTYHCQSHMPTNPNPHCLRTQRVHKSHCRSPLKMDGARNIAPVPEIAESRRKSFSL